LEIILSFEPFALPALILMGAASLILLISHDWRLNIGALSAIYVGAFILVAFSWPLEMAVVKLVAGWISASVLGIGLVNSPEAWYRPARYWSSEIVFRISAAGLFMLAAVSLAPVVQEWVKNATNLQVLGGLILIGMGVLHLGLTTQPLRTVLGLLTVLAGFEILYAIIETSVLVAGFLAVINLGIALTGAYLLISPEMEPEE
jgi:hypothetical protein